MIDFHTHIIFMEEIKSPAKWGVVGKYFICPDSKYPFGTRSIKEIETRMNYGKIDSAVVLPIDCERVRGESLLTNKEVKILCDASPRLIGFASIDPVKTSVMQDLEEAKSFNLKGLKLDPGLQGFRLSDVTDHPMWRQIENYRWPVVIHAGFCFTPGMSMYSTNLVDIEKLAYTYPKINFVIAHWAFPWVMEAVLLAIKIPNIYLDSSMAYFDNPADYTRFILEKNISASIMEKSIREKVLFGSNYPRVRMESMKMAYEKWPISDKAKACLFNDNAERLLNNANGG